MSGTSSIQTEIGHLPTDWKVKTGQDLGEVIIGLTYSPRDVSDDGWIVLRSANIQNGSLCYDDIVTVSRQPQERLIVRTGDVLICARNGSRRLIGKSIYIRKDVEYHTFGTFMLVFRSHANDYVGHFISSEPFQKQVRERLGATINQITSGDLKSFLIPEPPAPERTAINEVLTDADEAIGATARLIEKKRAVRQGAAQALLSGDVRLPGFEGVWEPVAIGALLTVRYGRSQKEVVSNDGPYPILATGGQIGRAHRALYDGPSVLIGRKGTIGRPMFIGEPFWTVDTLFYSHIHTGNDARFLAAAMDEVDWLQYNEASGVPSLNASTISSVEIMVPPTPAEQAAIADVLTDMDDEIAALGAKLDKLRLLKTGLMQELLTGRTRLV